MGRLASSIRPRGAVVLGRVTVETRFNIHREVAACALSLEPMMHD